MWKVLGAATIIDRQSYGCLFIYLAVAMILISCVMAVIFRNGYIPVAGLLIAAFLHLMAQWLGVNYVLRVDDMRYYDTVMSQFNVVEIIGPNILVINENDNDRIYILENKFNNDKLMKAM